MLNVYILVASVLMCLIVGSLVVSRGLNDKKVIIYGLLTLFMLIMSISNFLSLYIDLDQLFFVRSVMFSTTIAAFLIYLLIYNIKKRDYYVLFYRSIFFYLTLIVAGFNFTDFLFSGVVIGVPPKPIPGMGGVGVIVFFAHLIIAMVLSIKRLYSDIKTAKKGNEKRQYTLLVLGLLPIVILSPITGFLLPSIGIGQLIVITPLYAVIFVVLVGYAIIRHGLFDIRQAVIRTITYVLSLGVLAIIYYVITYLISVLIFSGSTTSNLSVNPINIGLALILAFIFQPVKKFFDKVTNRIFYKDNYNTDDFFAKLNKVLGFTTDLRGLLERTAIEIGTTLKGDQAFFYINTDNGHYITAGTPKHKQLPKEDAEHLNTVAKTKSGVIIASLMDDTDPIKRLMASHRIELILPLMQGSDVIGYLCLGEHKTSSYTNRDIKVLNTISNELIIAIQNALAVQEIREFNITLQQRIANATRELRASNAQLRHLDKAKDEFLSMASHQLRTPLTSVKGYISMVMEGDAGKVTTDQTKLLGEAFTNSEHMVSLIDDFLNVSRIQTGKFAIEKVPTDLAKLVQQEVTSLMPSATSRKLAFNYNMPTNIPMIDVDAGKIRQVVMNFMDNSLYYSKEDTKIDVNLSVIDDNIVFTVKDTGIGVPKSEQDELFTKFYRASNAKKKRPDGTGVGLFLAKKVVDGHGGKIIFESVEGKGSTFGFSLPIDKLIASSDANNFDNQNNN